MKEPCWPKEVAEAEDGVNPGLDCQQMSNKRPQKAGRELHELGHSVSHWN